MFNRIRSFFKSESDKLKGLTMKQKLGYVRDYYWLQISLVVIVLTLGSFVIYRVRTTLSDHWFYLMLANTREEAGTNSPLWKGYVDYSGYDLSEKLIEFNDEAWFDYGKNKAAGNKYYEIFVGFTDVGILDAVTMEPDNLTSLGESGRLLDLNADKCSRHFCGGRLLRRKEPSDRRNFRDRPLGKCRSAGRVRGQKHGRQRSCLLRKYPS